MMRILMGLLAFSSSLLMAQDYYSPTTKDKEPLARFPIDVVVENGVMTYTLPSELVGIENHVSLSEVSRVDGVRTFSGDKATAVCMGAEKTPGCVVTHRKLEQDKAAAALANVNKFTDNTLQRMSFAIADEFLDHSGNEPIGFIGALIPRKDKWQIPGSVIGKVNGQDVLFHPQWSSTWVKDVGGYANTDITFDPNLSKASTSAKGDMTVSWTPYHATGKLLVGGDTLWFDLTFSADLKSFDGIYGKFEDGNETIQSKDGKIKVEARKTTRLGRWYGNVKP